MAATLPAGAFVGNLPIDVWPPAAITQPYRIDVAHKGQYKMAGLVIRLHPGPTGPEWSYYHAHSGTQHTRNYTSRWGWGIDQCVVQELVFERVAHLYIHDRSQKSLHYLPTDKFVAISTLHAAGGRWRLFVPESRWDSVPVARVPAVIAYIPPARWIKLDPPVPPIKPEE